MNISLLLDIVLSSHLGTHNWKKVKNYSGEAPSKRSGMQMAAIDDELFFFGGCSQYLKSYHNDCFVFHPLKMTWRLLNTTRNPSPRIDFGLAVVSGRRCVLFGGLDGFVSFSDTHIFERGIAQSTRYPTLDRGMHEKGSAFS